MIKDFDNVRLRSWVKPGDIIAGIQIHDFMMFDGARIGTVVKPGMIDVNGFVYPEPALEVSEDANS